MKGIENLSDVSGGIGRINEIVTERSNLFEPNVYIMVCAEIEGKICPHKLSAAVK